MASLFHILSRTYTALTQASCGAPSPSFLPCHNLHTYIYVLNCQSAPALKSPMSNTHDTRKHTRSNILCFIFHFLPRSCLAEEGVYSQQLCGEESA